MPTSTLASIPPEQSEEDIDLLDLLVVIANNLKLLIFAPILVGVLALAVGYALPKTFESVSILDGEKAGVAASPSLLVSLATSADLLDTVAIELGIEPDATKATRLKTISALVTATPGRQDKLITLRTRGETPEQAQRLNVSIWKHLLPLTAPRGNEMARLQGILKAEQSRLEESKTLEQVTAQMLQNGRGNENSARLYGELLTSNSTRMRTIATLQAQMEGLTFDNLLQTPTLPEQAVKPKKSLIAIGAGLATGFLLLLFVFARQALQSALLDPERAAKVAQLRAALGRRD